MAQDIDQQFIDPLHLLIALIDQSDGITTPIFQKIGINLKLLLSILYNEFGSIPKETGAGRTDILLSQDITSLFDTAWKEME